MKTVYKEWTLIEWDGNPGHELKCWRKSFGRGHVSVGVGDFLNIVFSHGANSDYSLTSTRWNYNLPILTEEQAMEYVDMMGGFYDHRIKHPAMLQA